MNLVKAELLKVRTTSTWWVFGLISLPLWGLSLLLNWAFATITANVDTNQAGVSAEDAQTIEAVSSGGAVAANLYTNGQFLGVLIVMLLAAIIVTNEFSHQTATTTFLTTPTRTSVVLAKLVAAVILGLVFWLVTTVLNLAAGPLVLHALDLGPLLGEGAVWRAVALNALAYAVWAVLGVGVGVLIRSQVATVVTITMVYLVGYIATSTVWPFLAAKFGEWFDKAQVLVPTQASQLMVAGVDLPGQPPRWVGAVVLLGYALATGVIGTTVMRRRDIS